MAAKPGLTQRAYAHWERHSVALRHDQSQRLAAIFQVSVDELLGETGKNEREEQRRLNKKRRKALLTDQNFDKVVALADEMRRQHDLCLCARGVLYYREDA